MSTPRRTCEEPTTDPDIYFDDPEPKDDGEFYRKLCDLLLSFPPEKAAVKIGVLQWWRDSQGSVTQFAAAEKLGISERTFRTILREFNLLTSQPTASDFDRDETGRFAGRPTE